MIKDLATIAEYERIIKRMYREKQSAESMIRWLTKAKQIDCWYQFDYILIWISDYNLYYVKKNDILYPMNTALSYVKVKDCRTVNPLWVIGTFISDYLINVLLQTDLNTVCRLEQVIFETRKQYISEESDENDNSIWMKLLFSVHDFNRSVQMAFKKANQLIPDSKRYYKLNREMKSLYVHALRHGNPWNGKSIVIKQIPHRVFPEVCVTDINGDQESMLQDYSLEDIIRMKIDMDKGDLEKEEYTVFVLLWIYTYILYPVRMQRLNKINDETIKC